MGVVKNIAGQRFGRLVALSPAGKDKYNKAMWHCACDCGRVTRAKGGNLSSGHTKSCGCARGHGQRGARRAAANGERVGRRTGGVKSPPEYGTWRSMKNRCARPSCDSFKYYGARGVAVCARWLNFQNFLADTGPKPSSQHSIDRIDPNGHYEPGNCRWATASEQGQNKRPKITTTAPPAAY